MSHFMFATGIENSYPTISAPNGKSQRVDEMEKCGHYKRWREDFHLVNELGRDKRPPGHIGNALAAFSVRPGPLASLAVLLLGRRRTSLDFLL